VKDSFYEELERVFDKFTKNRMKILLGNFSVKVDREYVFKPTIRNESLHEIGNDNGATVINSTASKNHAPKSKMLGGWVGPQSRK
jgi:hypothetical protein